MRPSPMPTRRLGSDGPWIAALGFGAWAVGGDAIARTGAGGGPVRPGLEVVRDG